MPAPTFVPSAPNALERAFAELTRAINASNRSLADAFADALPPRVAPRPTARDEAAVERGVAFLDRRFGRDVWLSRVDPDTLNVRLQLDCVLAQVTGRTYVEALDVAGVPSGDSSFRRVAWTDRHGFSADLASDADTRESCDRYASLTAAWVARISELRAESDSVRITA